MKKRIIVFLIVIIISILFYINKMIEFEYNLNIIEYLDLTSDYTEDELSLLKEHEPLIYAGNVNEAPLGIYSESGQSVGLVVDYVNALSIELGINIISKPMKWTDVLDAIAKGEADLGDMVPSEKRKELYSFSDPIYNINGAVLVPTKNQSIFKVDDLNNKIIAIQDADYGIDSIISRGLNVEFIYTDNFDEALNLLYKGDVDAVVGDEPVIMFAIRELSNLNDYQILEEYIYESVAALAMPKSNDDLVKVINKAIFNLKRKGILDSINTKWMTISSTFYDDMAEEKLKLGILIVLFFITILVSMVLLWNRSLKYLVNERTSELEFTKNELQITFDGMKSFIILFDDQYTIKNINLSFLKYINKNKEDVIEKSIKTIPVLNSYLKDNDIIDNTFSELKFDKKIFEIQISFLENVGKDTQFRLFILSDITTEKIQNQKVIQTNKMIAIGQLASGIAHEIRNPLGVIRNSTFILKDEYEDIDTLKLKALNAIDKSVDRASKIIDNLLNFSRLTNDKIEVINLHSFYHEIISLFNKTLRENDIRIIVKCSNDIILETKVESLRHILINLISNAIDSMNKGKNIYLCCEDDKDFITLKVTDEGCGMTDEEKEKIFEPFYTTKQVGKGTGLGLYIVYSELQKIGGEILVESIKEVGTTFNINIAKEV